MGPNRESRLLTNLHDSNTLTVRTSLTLEKRAGAHWATAGLLLFEDSENLWRLVLVESPDHRRYLELIERYQGTHQAQNQPTRTRLPSKLEGKLRSWEYGRQYALTLSVSPESICGEIRELDSGRLWRKTFSFVTNRAVRGGRPGLGVAGFRGEFGPLTAQGKLPPMMRTLTVRDGPKGSAVVLQDQTGRAAGVVQRILQEAGYGATILTWDACDGGRIPAERVDLLVLADARRVPDSCKASIVSFLRAGGKLMAIGAPAFGVILSKTPTGWAAEADYNEAIFNALTPRPVELARDEWRYTAPNREKSFGVEAQGQSGYRFRLDLEGFGTFGKKLTRPFPENHTVLTFWAKGDDHTRQLCVECRETDGSRWIATIDLATSWCCAPQTSRIGPIHHPSEGSQTTTSTSRKLLRSDSA